jgi:molybdate transport repressor ModE-like protein
MEPSEFHPHYKIWLSKRRNKKKEKGNYVLGGGGAELLRLIGEEKDLGKAAKKLNISYKKAWNILHKMKENCGESPVISHRGGKGGGGGIELSETGSLLLEMYSKFEIFFKSAISDFYDYVSSLNENKKKKSP